MTLLFVLCCVRPDISSEAFLRSKPTAPTHRPSQSTSALPTDVYNIPIATLKAQLPVSGRRAPGIPRAAVVPTATKSINEPAEPVEGGVKWHEHLRGGPSKPVKGA